MAGIIRKEKALLSIKYDLIPAYFGTVRDFTKAKILLLKKIEANGYENKTITQPISAKHFRNDFEFLCSNYEQLVGSIALLGKEEPNYLIPNLGNCRTNEPINWHDLSIDTIANAEHLFRDAQQRVRNLLSNPSPSDQICNRLIDQIKPLAGAEPYQDIRRIYWMLYCELRVTIQLHKPDGNWDFFFSVGKHPEHWFKLRSKNDFPALKYLKEHTWNEYENNPKEFRDGLLSAVKADCISESLPTVDGDILKPISKASKKNHLILIPKARAKKHQNIIFWYDSDGKEQKILNVFNDPFDFIYYVAWLYENGNKDGLYGNGQMHQQDKNAIIPGYSEQPNPKRFVSAWTKAGNADKQKKPSQLKSDYYLDLIKWTGTHYRFHSLITVELMPYPEE